MIITIDGPAVSGKSTIALALAKELGGYYIYSGLLFRGAAYLLHTHAHYDEDTIQDVSDRDIDLYLDPDRFIYTYCSSRGPRVLFDDVDITQHLYGAKMGQYASLIGTNQVVRDVLKKMQHTIAEGKKLVIVDGRDSGSVVFPDADYMFFMTANLDERAQRMQHAQEKKGISISLDDARQEIQKRDMRDKSRSKAPLKKPEQAIEVDTSNLSRKETVKKILYDIQSV